MENRRTYRLLIWAVIILLATNISMAVSFMVHKKQDHKNIDKQEQITIEVPTEQRAKFFREQLGLLPEQMDPFRDYNRTYNRASNRVAQKLEALRIEMVFELGKEKTDEKRLTEITTEFGQLHAELKKITVDYYQQMNTACNPEQRKKLNAIFMSMVCSDNAEKPRQQGRGHRYGNQ